MPNYAVVSPQWEEYQFRLDDGTGPTEPVCLYLEVEAPTARRAKVLAVQAWRKTGDIRKYCEYEESPFKGLKAINLDLEDEAGNG